MDDILNKLRLHKKLNFEDIKKFIMYQVNKYQLSSYLKEVETIFSNSLYKYMSYETKSRKLQLYPNTFKYIYTEQFIKMYPYKFTLLKEFILKRHIDFYNLMMLYFCFHEIKHAYQTKNIKNNTLSSSLLRVSLDLMKKDNKLYSKYHNIYYAEYNANINAILLLLDFINKNCNDYFNTEVLELINREFANQILSGYGYNQKMDFDANKYNCPIDFFDFLLEKVSILDDDNIDIQKVKSVIKTKESFIGTNIDDLTNGLPLPDYIIETLESVSKGNTKTINLIKVLDEEFSIHNQFKNR